MSGPSRLPRPSTSLALLLALLLVATIPATAAAGKRTSSSGSTYTFQRASSPARTLAYDRNGRLVATFTDGARTVTLAGPSRTFAEPTYTSYTVTTTTWVRLLSQPFSGTVDQTWLTARLADTSGDVLATALQYVIGAAPIYDETGLRIAGDADYGPLNADGTRQEGSDFNDYLGIAWTYPSGTDNPEADQIGALDCSGFVRMVFGYRRGIPLTLEPNAGASLPRRAYQQEASAPGITVIANSGSAPQSRSALAPGDLVFFDADTGDGTQIDHVAIFLGQDSGGHDRFLSSRKSANGPTMGDLNGRSILDGTGTYASAFRAARRL